MQEQQQYEQRVQIFNTCNKLIYKKCDSHVHMDRPPDEVLLHTTPFHFFKNVARYGTAHLGDCVIFR